MSEVDVADVTAALTAPKYTMLSPAVALKLPPVMVIAVPTGPAEGEKEVITGAWANDCKTPKIINEKRNNLFFIASRLSRTIIAEG